MARLHSEGLAPGNGEVVWLELDLSYPRKVKQSAEDFLGKESRLDMLGECLCRHVLFVIWSDKSLAVNNAGM